ncbi:Glycosyltransferase Family 1 protein [Trametes cinnabarina]|uniref:Glycosyltransferase Family 1 protein n=1 Tax=Pycnoporus cinnabarinus TaxID=5643 RepID=A0A060S4A1_PYCCI|nr:Glycosyltransferase Family 1 protein [Trametes cinnabarina]
MPDPTLDPPKSHLVAFAYEAWGHTRPLIVFCARAVKTRPILVTFLTPESFYDRATAELARNFEFGEEGYRLRVRIVALARGDTITSQLLDIGFASSWRKLVEGEELVCAKTGRRIPAMVAPQAAILDCFGHQPLMDIRKLSGDKAKVYIWFPGMLTALSYFLFGPESVGSRSNWRDKAEEVSKRTGRDALEVMAEIMFETEGEIVRAPGMPPMYEYEYHPQDFPMPEGVTARLLLQLYDSFMAADGLFVATPKSYEREAVAAMSKWYGELEKAFRLLRPKKLRPSWTASWAYLENGSYYMYDLSTIFSVCARLTIAGTFSTQISFGSIFWPFKNPEMLWAFLEVVMELDIPFILSHASALAAIPESLADKIQRYRKGLTSRWVPQQLILNHPVTGWFVTHGGHNSVLESIVAGIPQIFWPFESDQPINAVRLTEVFNVAYELIEVRTGHGTKPVCRNGRMALGTLHAIQTEARDTLTRAFGEEGAEKRARILRLRDAVREEWSEPSGASRRDFLAFLETFGRAA